MRNPLNAPNIIENQNFELPPQLINSLLPNEQVLFKLITFNYLKIIKYMRIVVFLVFFCLVGENLYYILIFGINSSFAASSLLYLIILPPFFIISINTIIKKKIESYLLITNKRIYKFTMLTNSQINFVETVDLNSILSLIGIFSIFFLIYLLPLVLLTFFVFPSIFGFLLSMVYILTSIDSIAMKNSSFVFTDRKIIAKYRYRYFIIPYNNISAIIRNDLKKSYSILIKQF